MIDVSDGLRLTPHTSPTARFRACDRVERVPLAEGALVEDVGFGEDYELLAATPDPLSYTVIGRCEGSGVGLTRKASPSSSPNWEHRQPARSGRASLGRRPCHTLPRAATVGIERIRSAPRSPGAVDVQPRDRTQLWSCSRSARARQGAAPGAQGPTASAGPRLPGRTFRRAPPSGQRSRVRAVGEGGRRSAEHSSGFEDDRPAHLRWPAVGLRTGWAPRRP